VESSCLFWWFTFREACNSFKTRLTQPQNSHAAWNKHFLNFLRPATGPSFSRCAQLRLFVPKNKTITVEQMLYSQEGEGSNPPSRDAFHVSRFRWPKLWFKRKQFVFVHFLNNNHLFLRSCSVVRSILTGWSRNVSRSHFKNLSTSPSPSLRAVTSPALW